MERNLGMFSTPKELAEAYAAQARSIYERDGEVDAILALVGQRVLVMRPAQVGTDRPPEMFGKLIAVFRHAVQLRHAVVVVESWGLRDVTPVDELYMEHGYLEELALKGDPRVHTTLTTLGIDFKVPERCHSVLSDSLGDEMRREWEIHRVDGRMPGDLMDYAYHGFENPLVGGANFPLEMMVEVMVETKLVHSAALDVEAEGAWN